MLAHSIDIAINCCVLLVTATQLSFHHEGRVVVMFAPSLLSVLPVFLLRRGQAVFAVRLAAADLRFAGGFVVFVAGDSASEAMSPRGKIRSDVL